MRVRIKPTGQVEDYPGGVLPVRIRAMVAGGTAEFVEPAQPETAALETGEREQTRAKKPAARRI